VTVALHALVTFWSPANAKVRVQPAIADVPVLVMVRFATNPPAH
jgi:hypothetical protein